MIQKEEQEVLAQQVFNTKFKKLDFIIIFTVAIISALIFFMFSNQNSNVVEVYVSGDLYGKYPLYDNNNVKVSTENGSLTVCINNGKVCVIDADCSDKECEKQGFISGKGRSVICLPLETVIKIGEENYEIAY